MASPFPTFKNGLLKIRDNPQLVYSILIALIITAAFIFMSDRFIDIANSAQERLINVRMGSLQDAFASFAGDRIDDTAYLNDRIRDVMTNNETIKDFRILKKEIRMDETTGALATDYIVIASSDPDDFEDSDPRSAFLYSLASADPANSLTVETRENNERIFETARAITDREGGVEAVIISRQTLSLADIAIESSIARNTVILAVVLILIMFLFLRHAKIIDYVVLYRKLSEVDKLKDDFIAMASHELRAPLTVIRGYVDFIKGTEGLSQEVREYASRIDLSAKDLDLLVADILDASRIEQGRMNYNMIDLDPCKIVEEVTASMRVLADQVGLRLSFEKEISGAQLVKSDENRLRQVFVNIIGNAIKYTKAGDVKVRAYAEAGKIYFRISDTGIGMSAEEQKRLFEKFYRVKNSETKDIRGTGLGLWITAQIVKDMNGTISVESIKGVGTHFELVFKQSNPVV